MRLRGNKFGAVRTEVDGITFHSKREAVRYGELKILEKGGYIRALRLQPRFPLVVNDILICTYVGDFQYEEKQLNGFWVLVVEDVKGMKTTLYKLKAKLMKAIHGIDIRETK